MLLKPLIRTIEMKKIANPLARKAEGEAIFLYETGADRSAEAAFQNSMRMPATTIHKTPYTTVPFKKAIK